MRSVSEMVANLAQRVRKNRCFVNVLIFCFTSKNKDTRQKSFVLFSITHCTKKATHSKLDFLPAMTIHRWQLNLGLFFTTLWEAMWQYFFFYIVVHIQWRTRSLKEVSIWVISLFISDGGFSRTPLLLEYLRCKELWTQAIPCSRKC